MAYAEPQQGRAERLARPPEEEDADDAQERVVGAADGASTTASFRYPSALAAAPDGASLFVADLNQLIRRVAAHARPAREGVRGAGGDAGVS